MSNVMLGFPNYIDSANLSGGSWQPSLPLSNLKNRVLGRVARTVDAWAGNSYVVMDLIKSRKIRTVSAINHNLSIDAQYRLRGSNEQSAQNLLNQLGYDPWGTSNIDLVYNAAAAPDGTQTALKAIAIATSGVNFFAPVSAPGKVSTFSIFFKRGNTNNPANSSFGLYNSTTGTDVASMTVNFATGQITSTHSNYAGSVFQVKPSVNGWWRASITVIAGVATNDVINCYAGATGGHAVVGDSWYVWGAQYEAGYAATSIWLTPPTFTSRASSATYYDSNGFIKTAGPNVARNSYDPNNLANPPRLLVEKAATNRVADSESLLPANGWSGGCSRYPTSVQYRGGPYYSKVAKNTTATSEGYGISTGTVVAGAVVTATVALRADSAGAVAVGLYDSTNNSWGPDNLSSAEILEGPGVISQSAGGLWNVSGLTAASDTLIRITRTHNATTSIGTVIYVYPGLPSSTTIADAVLCTRVQVEDGPYCSSYIATSGGTAARSADVVSYNRTRPAGYFDSWQSYDFDSGWQNVWSVVYDYMNQDWEDDNWWTGRYTDEERAGYTPALIHLLPQDTLAQYWKLELSDTNNPSGYVQLGRIFIGPVWQPSVNLSTGANIGWATDTDVQKAIGGTEYFGRRTPYRMTKFVINYLGVDEAFGKAFEIQRRAGIDSEVLYIHDPDDTYHALRRRFLGRLKELNPIEFPYVQNNSAAFQVKELL